MTPWLTNYHCSVATDGVPLVIPILVGLSDHSTLVSVCRLLDPTFLAALSLIVALAVALAVVTSLYLREVREQQQGRIHCACANSSSDATRVDDA